MKIATNKLQELMSRVSKGAGNNKMLPITSLIGIKLSNNVLSLETTDGTNFLYIQEDEVEGDNFEVTIKIDTFAKLVSKMTCETIELSLNDNTLIVRGNGTYHIDIPIDENGNMIKYPDPYSSIDKNYSNIIILELSTVKNILKTNKAALATTFEVPCYTNYYVGDTVMSTDTYKICKNDISITSTPMLISANLMDLLDVITCEEIKLVIENTSNMIAFSTPDCKVVGRTAEGIEDYAIASMNGVLSKEFSSYCSVNRDMLIHALDRVALFIDPYDKGAVSFTFTNEGLSIGSRKSTGVEIIEYHESEKFKEFTCLLDVVMMESQLKSLSGDYVKIYYGDDACIKMVEGNVTEIVALSNED